MDLEFWRVTPKKRSIKRITKKGVLYSNPGIPQRTIYYVGTFLSIFSVFFLLYLYYPIGKAYFAYWQSNKGKSPQELSALLVKENGKIEKTPAVPNYYGIKIPKINAEAAIVENVTPYDSTVYKNVLDEGKIAQSSTSTVPGRGKGSFTYLFAHSSEEGISVARKNVVFYLLGELSSGDSVWIERNGIKYLYKVFDKKIVSANDVEYLHYSNPNKEVLILQTCWPVGTDWNRLLVFAELMAY
ncbi:sortase [Patescibacteria group bacterium]|nr:sortase [Patescibacteria group bacterium]